MIVSITISSIYKDAGQTTLRALYADNEGHVLHYEISTPDASTAVFVTTSFGGQSFG